MTSMVLYINSSEYITGHHNTTKYKIYIKKDREHVMPGDITLLMTNVELREKNCLKFSSIVSLSYGLVYQVYIRHDFSFTP